MEFTQQQYIQYARLTVGEIVLTHMEIHIQCTWVSM